VETITITVSMYDRSRRAEVTLATSTTVGELMEQCSMRWSLPLDTFIFRHVGSNEMLLDGESLRLAGIRDGAELQIYPIVEGG
jgi:hypothetical protein